MKTLIITPNKDSFIKTVMFLYSMGFNFPSDGETTEDRVAELHDYIRNRWDTLEDDVMAIYITGKFFTVNTKRFYQIWREPIDNETVSPIM